MRVGKKTWIARSPGVSLKNWDGVLGKIVRGFWGDMTKNLAIARDTPICLDTGELMNWAVAVHSSKIAEGARISPSEHLNVEGGRIVRYLVTAGWHGPAHVLNSTAAGHELVCTAMANRHNRQIVGIRVGERAGEPLFPTWEISMTAYPGIAR